MENVYIRKFTYNVRKKCNPMQKDYLPAPDGMRWGGGKGCFYFQHYIQTEKDWPLL